MTKSFEIAVFDGDGIGPEVMTPTLQILQALAGQNKEYDLSYTKADAGAAHYTKTGQSLPEASVEIARRADAILLSAMGDPAIRYKDGTEIAPQIELRKIFDLYAGVRPVRILPGQRTPLKLVDGQPVDFVLIRESTEGLFYCPGESKATKDEVHETLVITRKTSEKLFRFAFNLAQQRRSTGQGPGLVTCVDKANVFRAFAFFREIFDLEAAKHPSLTANHAYVDATALWMVEKPWIFDVMVTENMFGDILSDLGAGLMGGLGMAPSADIGDDHAVFQPCHGSAPDIAGQGVANPFAMILSGAMMLEWLGFNHDIPGMLRDAADIRKAVDLVAAEGVAITRDIGGTATTETASGAVLSAIMSAR